MVPKWRRCAPTLMRRHVYVMCPLDFILLAGLRLSLLFSCRVVMPFTKGNNLRWIPTFLWGSNYHFHVFQPWLPDDQILFLKSRSLYRWDLSCRWAKRKSQKLLPFILAPYEKWGKILVPQSNFRDLRGVLICLSGRYSFTRQQSLTINHDRHIASMCVVLCMHIYSLAGWSHTATLKLSSTLFADFLAHLTKLIEYVPPFRSRTEDPYVNHKLSIRSPGSLDKCWPAVLAVPISRPAWGGNFNRERGFIAHSLTLSPIHRII